MSLKIEIPIKDFEKAMNEYNESEDKPDIKLKECKWIINFLDGLGEFM